MNRPNGTRNKVLDVACRLFYSQGFNGTSVRDIAKAANVNVSLIHYYFKSKQGLFESLAVSYFEPYLDMLESEQPSEDGGSLHSLVKKILHYKQSHYQLSCLLNRELSLNTVFAREMLVTYLAKENHLFTQILFDKHSHIEVTFKEKLCLLQLKGLLNAPFTMPHEFKDPFITEASIDHFVNVYSDLMNEHQSVQLIAAKV
ncbi:forespore capture DNA-binding protein RefZ [Halobacillus litoralis]|uniref:Forespore capture DNA-binding protein RefZ n=1 Tax=Halobacillus litoralis TaxID=45668 RepID=A0A845DUR1_9BACI|nr:MULTISPECIES: forespore capture DNA-binding protein RefZ [Halobacillus]MCA1021914.1 forespore capture DNA-binding protein RefZ [Halobacillus litoralis]MYL20052.1 forespore capture DNA-binding protein RefZ [Halobacillus litoralis]MYL29189.1 forespore capture DNA-binding protein RefZ [Halobacillus halophilus]MYL38958.1 forespore capture DNA-binding protein RefZ [Halobacillus litoralis]